jgi:hypothetical protein
MATAPAGPAFLRTGPEAWRRISGASASAVPASLSALRTRPRFGTGLTSIINPGNIVNTGDDGDAAPDCACRDALDACNALRCAPLMAAYVLCLPAGQSGPAVFIAFRPSGNAHVREDLLGLRQRFVRRR